MKQEKMEPIVEEIGEDARLLWIGPRQTDRVILYFHGGSAIHRPQCTFLTERREIGGAFILSAGPAAPGFWNFIRKELELRGESRIDAVMLNYSEFWIYFRSYQPPNFLMTPSTRPGCHVSSTAEASRVVNPAPPYSRFRTKKYLPSRGVCRCRINSSGLVTSPSPSGSLGRP